MFASKANDVLRIKKLNTLFLSYDGMTDSLGQSQVIPYLIGLSKSGYSISIVSCEKQEAFEKNQQHIQQLLAPYSIEWFPLTYTKKPPVLSTLKDLFLMNRKMNQLHREKKFILVHCRSYLTSLLGEQFCRKNGIPFIFDMRGFWADERIEGGIWKLSNPLFNRIYRFFKKKELMYVTNAAATVSLTHAGKREIQSWDIDKVQKEKIFVIPCSADFELFAIPSKLQRQEARARLNWNETNFVLTYLGSLGTWYLLNEMLDFFSVLREKIPTSKLYIISGDSPQLVFDAAKAKGISSDDIVVESAKRAEVPKKLAASDWGISFIKPSFSKKASSPTKMGEMLAMGIPLLVNSGVGDVAQIVEQTQGGICIDTFTNESYATAIDKMKLGKLLPAAQIREKSFEIYGLENAIKTYVGIYKMCSTKNRI